MLGLLPAAPAAAGGPTAVPESNGGARALDWQSWQAGNSVSDLPSLQRGARNFMNYCNGCHALQVRALSAHGG
jgi:ubiquinol-cytochrome c reductase cytochrome c1 subunit